MPEDRSPPEEARSNTRSAGKHKWRGKLFSTEDKSVRSVESTEDDIATFLQTASIKPKARPQPPELAPRVDTAAASRYPASAQAPEPAAIVDVYRRPKPRQNKGLRVAFRTAAPEIIGEGGDESLFPPNEVSRSLKYVVVPSQLQKAPFAVNEELPRDEGWHSPDLEDEPSFRPASLPRRPAGLDEVSTERTWGDKDRDRDTDEGYSSVPPQQGSKPLPPPPAHAPNAHGYISEIEPRDVHEDVSPMSDGDYEPDERDIREAAGFKGPGMSTYLGIPSPETLAGNSVTPGPSPQPPFSHQEALPTDYFPPAATGVQNAPKPQDSKFPAESQASPQAPTASEQKAISLRDIAKGLGDDSLDSFDARVRRFNDIFRLGVLAHTELMNVPFAQWIRISSWWFLKGRGGIESEVRSSQANMAPTSGLSTTLKQAYVDLAKAWWIVKEVTPNHPEVKRFGKASMNSLRAVIKSFGDQTLAEEAEVHLTIVANMRALTISMKRNGKLPPPDLEIQRLDLHVLLELPPLPTDMARLMVNNTSNTHAKGRSYIATPFFPTPIGDTQRHFSFGRMFVEMLYISRGNAKQEVRMPCVLSILRERDDWGVQAVIASQDNQINLVVSDKTVGGLSWKNAQWKIPSHEMVLQLSESIQMLVRFLEKDFKTLWGIKDYTENIQKSFTPRKSEELVFQRDLKKFQCDDAAGFPSEAIAECKLRIFEKKSAASDGTDQRKIHDGYRLIVVTPPSIKTLSSVNYDLGREHPILFGILRGNDGPRIVLRILPAARLFTSFHEANDVDRFRHILSGTSTTKEDHHYPPLLLQSLAITTSSIKPDLDQPYDSSRIAHLPWSKLRILNKGPPPYGHETLPVASSGYLRLLTDCEYGTLTDRVNLAPGELQLSLSVDNSNEIKLLRPPQSDMTWSLADERVSQDELDSVCSALKKMLRSTTIRTYHFRSISDLHSFQALVTGFSVLFDGIASNLAISRRRSVVPVHKRWEASSARLQIIKQEKTVQLIGFFKNFSHGACMNFVLKVTDYFEIFSKSGLFYLRIVDAKFALPKIAEDQNKDFACLDMPEYPSEHDDITIAFDNEPDRDKFGESLPAPVNKMSRMASLRR